MRNANVRNDLKVLLELRAHIGRLIEEKWLVAKKIIVCRQTKLERIGKNLILIHRSNVNSFRTQFLLDWVIWLLVKRANVNENFNTASCLTSVGILYVFKQL